MNGRNIATTFVGAVLLISFSWTGLPESYAQTLAQYTSEPPFLTTAVPPNVLLLMDVSGSMDASAYHNTGQAYDPAKDYFGYFGNKKCYSYSSNRFQLGANRAAASPRCGSGSPWDGNFLNYMASTRFEITKWVMMGGKCAPRVSGNCYPNGKLTFENDEAVGTVVLAADGISEGTGTRCFDRNNTNLIMYGGSNCSGGSNSFSLVADVASEPQGVIQQVGNKARFGLMKFNKQTGGGANGGGKIVAEVGSNLISLVNAIENTDADGFTPLAESLYEAARYFAQIPPAYTNSDYQVNQNKDPFYYQPPWVGTSQYVKCCKSFVMIFTDGQPTEDTELPLTIMDYAHTVASHAPVGFQGHCSGPPYVADGRMGCTVDHPSEPHISHGGGMTNHSANGQVDHHDNCSAYYGGINADTCLLKGSHYLDDMAYYAHTTDLRATSLPGINLNGSDATGQDLDGFQSLEIYTFFAFGSGSRILQDSAKYGGFEDRNNDHVFNAGDVWDQYNNYSGALGADGLPDTYFESSNADDMRDRFISAINSILRRSQSGSSVSILASSSTGEGALYRAFFYPSTTELTTNTDIRWTGYMQGLWVDAFGNLREDTTNDGRLVLNEDLIIKTILEPNGNVKAQKYADINGDGKADSPTAPVATVELREVNGIWEAGKQLALMSHANRRILTWVDTNFDGVVDSGRDAMGQVDGTHTAASGEVIPFTTASESLLAPYLRAGTAPFTASDIIQFIRGCYDTATSGPCPNSALLRDRRLTVPGNGLQVWKLGDPVHSTPTVVAAPKDRYDFVYGDAGYLDFYRRWRTRRQVAYVGANDGMLHAFNAGFYHRGDDPSGPSGKIEHGWMTNVQTADGRAVNLGDELWAFIPFQLLPHLRWLAQGDYTHVYYVDLTPKVTEARIFTPEGACSSDPLSASCKHPGGWGTILIGGFRMGGSCGACSAAGAPPMTVNIGGTDRQFYTGYFVLDITDPDAEPKLLWSFSDSGMGLSTSVPAVARMNPGTDGKTSNTNEQWYAVFGSGPTGYDGSVAQSGKIYAVDLKTGPKTGTGVSAANVFKTFPIIEGTGGPFNVFLGDMVAFDKDLDFRTDAVYSGAVVHDGTLPWRGRMYRLTTSGCATGACSPISWGWDSSGAGTGPNVPTEVMDTFSAYPGGSVVDPGPVTGTPAVTADDAFNTWVFFGTGRYFGIADKTNGDTQYLIGAKDRVRSGGCTQSGVGNCKVSELVNVSSVTICLQCASGTNQVSGITGVTTVTGPDPSTTLQGLVQSKDGWYTVLPTTRERSVSAPTILGGIVFFPTFVPQDDICKVAGDGYLYGLFYQTGSAYTEPVLGTTTVGSNVNANRSILIGEGTGLGSNVVFHIGQQGGGASGSGGSGGGCQSGVTGFLHTSTGLINSTCSQTGSFMSRYVSWINQRE